MLRQIVAWSLLIHACFAKVDIPFQKKSSLNRAGTNRSPSTLKSSPSLSKSKHHRKQSKLAKQASRRLDMSSLHSSDSIIAVASSEAIDHNANTTSADNGVKNCPHDLLPTKRPKKKRRTTTTTATSPKGFSSSPQSSTKKMRLQREWKDTVAAGVGFDWKKGRPVTSTAEQQEEENENTCSSIWLGPIQSMDEWHFSFVGFGDPYQLGVYHGVVLVPADYPHRPPKIQLWTDSGRFQTFQHLCLDVSHYHPESWRPTLSIRSLVESVRLHMTTPADCAIGSLGDGYNQRKSYAMASRRYVYTRRGAGSKCCYTIDHGKMIRNGWMKGIIPAQQQQQQDDGDDDLAVRGLKTATVSSPPSTTLLLQEILWHRPLRLLLVGAFCLLFLVLHI